MKTVFTFVMIMVVTIIKAQILLDENFNSYQTGIIIGQNGYQQGSSGTVAGSDQSFQVVGSGSDKFLKIITRPENWDYTLYKAFAVSWQNRNSGNNIIEVEYDLFTGGTSSAAANGGLMLIADLSGNWRYFGNLMYYDTKRLTAATWDWDYWFVYYNLGINNTPINLPANQWVRLKFSYSVPENNIWFAGPGFHTKFQDFLFWPPAINFTLSFQVNSVTGSNTSAEFGFDNIVISAVAQSSLGLSEADPSSSEIIIYPNPTKSILHISSKGKILSAYIYDWAGFRKEIAISNGVIDVKKLPAGSYILGLKTDAGFVKKKFIKNN